MGTAVFWMAFWVGTGTGERGLGLATATISGDGSDIKHGCVEERQIPVLRMEVGPPWVVQSIMGRGQQSGNWARFTLNSGGVQAGENTAGVAVLALVCFVMRKSRFSRLISGGAKETNGLGEIRFGD
jgi:hypothetical protein